MNKKRLIKWIDRFSQVPILVVGDLMLDRSVHGSVDRISPEAPVPVVHVNQEGFTAGGAGNVIYNLASLGAIPTLVAVYGSDSAGEDLLRDFQFRSLSINGLVNDPTRPTNTKVRILAGQQQIVRVDYEKKEKVTRRLLTLLIRKIKDHISISKGVVISDYGKGVISDPIIKTVIQESHRRKIGVTVDPKIEHFMNYRGVDCMTPNTKEAVEGMRTLPPKTDKGYVELGKRILTKLRTQSLLLTRGEKGMILFEKGKPHKTIATHSREVFDVTGAGDTVVAAFTLARSVGASCEDAAQISNFAAGVVVGKRGTATTSPTELKEKIRASKGN